MSAPVDGVRLSLWRALTVFRVVTLIGCLVLIVHWQSRYERPGVALLAGAGMIAVTGVIGSLALRGRAHHVPLVVADAVVTVGLTLLTIPAQTDAQQHGKMVTLTTIWAAGPAIEAAFVLGPLGGLAFAALQFAVSALLADTWRGHTLYSGVLLMITGVVVGFVATYSVRAEAELRTAAAAQAAVAERERLARTIHDGVLQVLGLVHRAGRGSPEWSTLADAAAEQEAALRGLITSQPIRIRSGELDLAGDLRSLRAVTVTVSTPADPVRLGAVVVREIGAAVRAALQNVALHAGAGAHAWVLLEVLDDAVRVTVRDDGAGIDAGRLEAAERDGRIGVARSVRGRIADLGGTCTITSEPGEGTEITMEVPTAG